MKKILPVLLCLFLLAGLSIPVAAASQAETLAQQLETMRLFLPSCVFCLL